jgi:hypothetical protein
MAGIYGCGTTIPALACVGSHVILSHDLSSHVMPTWACAMVGIYGCVFLLRRRSAVLHNLLNFLPPLQG